MSDVRDTTTNGPADASDVVDGPIGSASLRDPATSGPMGANLDALEPIDNAGDASDDTRPIDGKATDRSAPAANERQEPDHVGVDWERTSRDEG